ncbi:MAG: FAD-dependent oxidoreductase [Hyphomicrobium sp.]|nr:FAD-dependent oxidoreductase [Hyphomicrobium sp.]
MHHVILGAGPAGVTAAETIRGLDRNARITVIGGEGEPPYSRMAIPYLLHGSIEEKGTYLRQKSGHYESLGIEVLNARAGGIDSAARTLHLSGGDPITYDRLLIATGATPVIPRMQGSNLEGVVNCWTLADAREILKRADKGAPVVLVGAGFIGSIVLEALYQRGCDLTVVEIAPRMVARMMDETAGGMLGRWCREKGVRVFTGTKVEGITQNASNAGAPLSVALSNGENVPAKLVVLAAGVKSNTGFLVGSNVAVNWGIKVNPFLETTAKGVYAAGDCCEAIDISTGKPDMLAIQPVAVEHGRIAGQNMAGRPTPHRGSLNMNVLDTMGLISSSFGLWQGKPGGQTASLTSEPNFQYLKLNFEGDRMIGAQCVGMTDHVGMLRGLIQTGFRLGEWKDKLMASPERLREAYLAVAQGSPIAGPTGSHVKAPIAKAA